MDKFDYWMKTYRHDGTHNEELLKWLFNDVGYEYINNYAHFCEFAIAVQQKGYSTNSPPPESDFNKAMDKIIEFNKQHSGFGAQWNRKPT